MTALFITGDHQGYEAQIKNVFHDYIEVWGYWANWDWVWPDQVLFEGQVYEFTTSYSVEPEEGRETKIVSKFSLKK